MCCRPPIGCACCIPPATVLLLGILVTPGCAAALPGYTYSLQPSIELLLLPFRTDSLQPSIELMLLFQDDLVAQRQW